MTDETARRERSLLRTSERMIAADFGRIGWGPELADAYLAGAREEAAIQAAEIAALREERDRWYFAAGQRQDELNEAHRALEFCTRFIEIERDDNPAHLLAPDFVRRQVRIAKAQYGSTSWAALREEK